MALTWLYLDIRWEESFLHNYYHPGVKSADQRWVLCPCRETRAACVTSDPCSCQDSASQKGWGAWTEQVTHSNQPISLLTGGTDTMAFFLWGLLRAECAGMTHCEHMSVHQRQAVLRAGNWRRLLLLWPSYCFLLLDRLTHSVLYNVKNMSDCRSFMCRAGPEHC